MSSSGTSLPGPATLFRAAATAEAITWALLIIALILRAAGVTEDLVRPAGSVHGFVFLSYVVMAVAVWINQRWSAGTGVLAVLLAVVPFATIPFERHLARRGEPDSTWRLVDGGSQAGTVPERAERWVLRHPLPAVLLLVVVVAAVFTLLLMAGPPGEWFS